MFKLIIKQRATDMAKEAYKWYEEQSVGLGDSFLDELTYCYRKIELNPTHFGFIEKGYRRIILKRFPFAIIYEIFENEVVVFAVFHTSKDPDKRLKE